MSKAPWTDEQVANLNRWQGASWVHPFTCRCGNNLHATKDGWRCSQCDYTQDWAHDFMLQDPEQRNPFRSAEAGGDRGE